MGLMIVSRRAAPSICWRDHDLTLAEMLSDTIVQALMDADGVDPLTLRSELRQVARQRAAVQDREQNG
jgi:hypothetical protein